MTVLGELLFLLQLGADLVDHAAVIVLHGLLVGISAGEDQGLRLALGFGDGEQLQHKPILGVLAFENDMFMTGGVRLGSDNCHMVQKGRYHPEFGHSINASLKNSTSHNYIL